MKERERIGIIGYGNMGQALAEQLKHQYLLSAFDKDRAKLRKLQGIYTAENNVDLANKADTLILAVKPQDFDATLTEIKKAFDNKLIVSIAAGISTEHIEKILGKARVIRAMPNMPARIGEGLSCLCKGRYASCEDLAFAKELFECVGKSLIIDENMMNAATAVSGSGPGYFFDIVESHLEEYKKNPEKLVRVFNIDLMKAAESVGFNPKEAEILAVSTGTGSNLYLEKATLSPSEAKRQITSKGGTTEAGLEALHKTGSLAEAVKAALTRAEELARKE